MISVWYGISKSGTTGSPEFLYFHVLAVIFTDRNGRIDDVRDRHHDLFDALLEGLFFFLLKFSKGDRKLR